MSDTPKPVRPWDLFLQKERVEEEIKESRLAICAECPELIKLTKQCKKCGCLMEQKAKLPTAFCPLFKWGPDQSANLNVIPTTPAKTVPASPYPDKYLPGKNGKDSFYHLHIAKTGGTYVRHNITRFLSNNFKDNKIREIVSHNGWTYVTPETFVLTTLRDPAKRTVSHFAYSLLVNGYFNHEEYNDTVVKNLFLEWLESPNIEAIKNYQTKNLFFIAAPEVEVLPSANKDAATLLGDGFLHSDVEEFKTIDLSDKDVFARIKEVDIVLRDKNLNTDTSRDVVEAICNDFGFEYQHKPVILSDFVNNNVNDKSELLFGALSSKEIDRLYRMNDIDTELYFTESIYWRK